MIQKAKFDSSCLKQLNPLEFVKKDFSTHFQNLINLEAFNYEFINKFKKKEDLLNNNGDEDMLFDEKDGKSAFDKMKTGNTNKNLANFKNNLRPNINSLSSFYANKLNINMNNSNVSDETLNKSRLLNKSYNNISSRNTLSNKNIFEKEASDKIKSENNKIFDNKNEKNILNEINFKKLEEEVENDCCVPDDDFDGPHIKLDDQDSEMFISEIPRNINKNPLIMNNTKNNFDGNLIKIEGYQNVKNNIKIENSNEETDINKIRTAYNLAEKPSNISNKNNNNNYFDLNKKSNNVSILSFINKGVKKCNDNTLDLELKSDLSDNFEIAPKNKLISNQNGKRKNISGENENTRKNPKKKKANFK